MFKVLCAGVVALALPLTQCGKAPETSQVLEASTTVMADSAPTSTVGSIDAPATVPTDAPTTTVEVTTTTQAPQAPAGSRCPQFYAEALAAGWPASDWERLDYIMWRESRCTPTAHTVARRDNSYGLVQLNMLAHRKWVGPLVDWDFNRLYDPLTNLTIARTMFNMAQDTYGCGWQPWLTKKVRWCSK